MTMNRSAPLAIATRAIRLNSHGGMATPLAVTTSSSGPVDSASSAGGTTMTAPRAMSRYTTAAVVIAPNRARG